jgi:hypothetical protein
MIGMERPDYMDYCDSLTQEFDCKIFDNDITPDKSRCDLYETLRDHCLPFFEDFEKKIVKKETEVATLKTKPTGDKSPDCKLFCFLMRESMKDYCGKFKLQLTAFVLCKTLELLDKHCEEMEIFKDEPLDGNRIKEFMNHEESFSKLNEVNSKYFERLKVFCRHIGEKLKQCSGGQKNNCETLKSLNYICFEIPRVNGHSTWQVIYFNNLIKN